VFLRSQTRAFLESLHPDWSLDQVNAENGPEVPWTKRLLELIDHTVRVLEEARRRDEGRVTTAPAE
jgi:hypothetical protein